MTLKSFDLQIIFEDSIWANENQFGRDFSQFLKAKGLTGVEIDAKNRIIVQITKTKELEMPKPPEKKGSEKQEGPQPVKKDFDAFFKAIKPTTQQQSPKIKIFKDSIL